MYALHTSLVSHAIYSYWLKRDQSHLAIAKTKLCSARSRGLCMHIKPFSRMHACTYTHTHTRARARSYRARESDLRFKPRPRFRWSPSAEGEGEGEGGRGGREGGREGGRGEKIQNQRKLARSAGVSPDGAGRGGEERKRRVRACARACQRIKIGRGNARGARRRSRRSSLS